MNTFKAGASKVNITPPVGVSLSGYGGREKPSQSVADELFAKALVLSDEETEVAVVTTDLLGIPSSFAARVKSLVGEQIGLPPDHLLICASHTHYGPVMEPAHPMREVIGEVADQQWLEVTARKIAGAVLMAHNGLREAQIGVATGNVEGISYNRRTLKADGKVQMSWSMPDAQADLRFGPIDPEVGVLRVDGADGGLIATLINFACHPVCDNGSYVMSAEYPAHAMQLVESVEGGICLFALGCAGNINPIMRGEPGRRKTGRALGAEVLKLLQVTRAMDSAKITVRWEPVELPLKPSPPLEEARREAERARDEFVRLRTEGASAEEVAQARRKLLLPTRVLARAERFAGDTVSTHVQVIRIGSQVSLVGLPGEVFVEIGLQIKRYSPFDHTLVISLANDELNYVPTTKAYELGGYEQDWTFVGPGADKILLEAVEKLLGKLAT